MYSTFRFPDPPAGWQTQYMGTGISNDRGIGHVPSSPMSYLPDQRFDSDMDRNIKPPTMTDDHFTDMNKENVSPFQLQPEKFTAPMYGVASSTVYGLSHSHALYISPYATTSKRKAGTPCPSPARKVRQKKRRTNGLFSRSRAPPASGVNPIDITTPSAAIPPSPRSRAQYNYGLSAEVVGMSPEALREILVELGDGSDAKWACIWPEYEGVLSPGCAGFDYTTRNRVQKLLERRTEYEAGAVESLMLLGKDSGASQENRAGAVVDGSNARPDGTANPALPLASDESIDLDEVLATDAQLDQSMDHDLPFQRRSADTTEQHFAGVNLPLDGRPNIASGTVIPSSDTLPMDQ